DGVLVLGASHPPQSRLAVGGDRLPLCRNQIVVQRLRSRGDVGRRRARLVLRRHLPGRDAVVDLHPQREVVAVGRVELQRGQVEPALLYVGVVTGDAVRREELRRRRGGGGAGE